MAAGIKRAKAKNKTPLQKIPPPKKPKPQKFTRTSLSVPAGTRLRIAELARANNVTMGYLIETLFASIEDDAVTRAIKSYSGPARRVGRPPKDYYPRTRFDLTAHRLPKK